MNIILILSCFFLIAPAEASDHASAGSATSSSGAAQASSLPKCVNDPSQVDKVLQTLSANSKTKFKYDGYRKALAGDSDEEIAARLIYSETVAANCPDQNKQMAPLIAGVISNRIQRSKGDTKAVVFELNQFASSLNHYDQSAYKDFLCPRDSNLWSQALQLAEAHSLPANKNATMYYLNANMPGHPESPSKSPVVQTVSSNGKKCLTVQEDSSWSLNHGLTVISE